MKWEPVIGLEIHAQLATASKIFSGASTRYGGEPNTQACAVDLGLPGVLPVLNQEAVGMAVKFGLATNSTIAMRSVFARKNYFYPDLPKGYQISQYEYPIVHGGHLDIEEEKGRTKTIGITRAHLEEDAGKSLHGDFHDMTGIDLNRAGTPLIEIVSEPDMRSAREAVAYMRRIHALVRYLEICDGNMQEGSFRCDANISVRPEGAQKLGTRAELKNLNSFRFVERAIQYEIERQIDILEARGKILQETRLYDPERNETRPMRSKEEANDYRYFPDPDLLPVALDADFIEDIRKTLPELPNAKKVRFQSEYELNAIDAGLLTSSRELADFFEATVTASGNAKLSANWIMVELIGALNKAGKEIAESPIKPHMLGGMIRRIIDNTISGKIAKKVFDAMFKGEGDADGIIEAKGLKQVTDTGEIERFIIDAIEQNPNQVAQYRAGKEKLLGFFVGLVMKASRGKANPERVNELLRRKLMG
uniref:Aspartyl/glutamyl-tRNA(Asn/Gln) amidotransferase subunit B n=1 Tax=Candidatus Kentrum sp. SD TaxID=2126332 RepID=A0A451BPS8_9GAMM|nr:MAG: aspartyl/glutamyl-tRNA(Asn/Gln) amidotransferase subunit B [Candidatus Kentron sp. SD]VFK48083.1 MAG: aspartyl/glutamyl-tRNA(Asn/Gln) amidotransferase subunit B [Candidatus Kentron sp. SD]VFK80309.1 MAG: aspartyl/glutamyl-tRNA(Asn/Gln) amidotransferase subunit B [Candidatus Kentron sp. SD]